MNATRARRSRRARATRPVPAARGRGRGGRGRTPPRPPAPPCRRASRPASAPRPARAPRPRRRVRRGLRAVGRVLEARRHGLVGAVERRRFVPEPPIGVGRVRAGQRRVRRAAVGRSSPWSPPRPGRAGGGSGRRPCRATRAAPPRPGRASRRTAPPLEHRGGRERRREVAALVERGDEEGRARGPRQLVDPLGERPLEPLRERQVDRGEVERGLRQLEQRQRDPARELGTRARVTGGSPGACASRSRPALSSSSPVSSSSGSRAARCAPLAVPRGERQHGSSSRRRAEAQHLGGRVVEPVGVLDDEERRELTEASERRSSTASAIRKVRGCRRAGGRRPSRAPRAAGAPARRGR